MPEHQQIQQSKKTNTIFQKQATPVIQNHSSNPYSIIQRAKTNPKSLTHANVMQLQRTIGNRAVGRLLSSIGNTSTAQQATVQRQEIPEEETCPSCIQKHETTEEEEPIQGKMADAIQRQKTPEEEEPLQGMFENKPYQIACPSCFAAPIVQRQELEDEEKPLQGKLIDTVQRQEIQEEKEPLQTKRVNNTGMPDNLKAGVESLSGIDMSDVRVHYNSDKPAEVGALAYTQGTNIHVAPGQEKHLPHEAWHVVQQVQGRVQPTTQMKDGVLVNDDENLEHEADVMGERVFNSGLDVFFRQGAYEPGRQREQKLNAYELTHIIQQNAEAVRRSPLTPKLKLLPSVQKKENESGMKDIVSTEHEYLYGLGFSNIGTFHYPPTNDSMRIQYVIPPVYRQRYDQGVREKRQTRLVQHDHTINSVIQGFFTHNAKALNANQNDRVLGWANDFLRGEIREQFNSIMGDKEKGTDLGNFLNLYGLQTTAEMVLAHPGYEEMIGQSLLRSELIFRAELIADDWGEVDGLMRFATSVQEVKLGKSTTWAYLMGYRFQLEEMERAAKGGQLVAVEVEYQGTSGSRRADMELTDGTYIDCKAYETSYNPNLDEKLKFASQASDYALSGRSVLYKFTNDPPGWVKQILKDYKLGYKVVR